MMTWRCLSGVLPMALLLQACALGPNYRRPEMPVPEAFRGQEVVTPESIVDLPWWEVFQDDELQALIAEALRNNYDLQTAVARGEQARGQLITTRSAIFPQFGYQAAQRLPQLAAVIVEPTHARSEEVARLRASTTVCSRKTLRSRSGTIRPRVEDVSPRPNHVSSSDLGRVQ